jgi:hypothetical protein
MTSDDFDHHSPHELIFACRGLSKHLQRSRIVPRAEFAMASRVIDDDASEQDMLEP